MASKKPKVTETKDEIIFEFDEIELEEVKDKKSLPPNVEHKILDKEEMKKRKRKALELAKSKLIKEVK